MPIQDQNRVLTYFNVEKVSADLCYICSMNTDTLLQRLGVESLSEMQRETLSKYRPERNTVLLSPTGSGKTLAFSLIINSRLQETATGTQVLVVVPTRELAIQIESVLKKLFVGTKITCIYGGNSTKIEKDKLKSPPQILVGTPGRIIYHLERGQIDLYPVHTLVLDEFDKSLELGFQEQMQMILSRMDAPYKVLTSATSLVEYPSFLSLNAPQELNYLGENSLLPDITLKKITTTAQNKLNKLYDLVCELNGQKMLIFCNHRDAVDHISQLLGDRDVIHDVFHGGLEQFDRELAVIKFRNDSNRILITTDLAARGLDIPEVDAVIHYQVPSKMDAFIHRNGRTARMSAKGTAYIILKDTDRFEYLPHDIEEMPLERGNSAPEHSGLVTLMLTAGRKHKVSKGDIVGFLLNLKGIAKEDLGTIDVKDYHAFVAIDRAVVRTLLEQANNGKIKGKKVRWSRV